MILKEIIRLVAAIPEEEKRKLRDIFFPEQKHTEEDWLPTAENINSLPKGMKNYVCHLETNADPAGMVRENTLMKDLINQLEAKIEIVRKIKPEWIAGFFDNNEDFYTDPKITKADQVPNAIYIDGHLSPHAMAAFLNRKIEEEKK